MRLACDVEVTYTLAVTNGGASSKGTRSRASLTLGKKPTGSGPKKGKEEEMYMLVSTVKNVTGTSYKVKDNIIRIFGKFLKDGKATIKFKEPAHDLVISKADPVKLKEFLMLLRMTPQEQQTTSFPPDLPPKMKDFDKPPKKLVVRSRGDYPIKGFPSSLEIIEAVSIGLSRVDRRIIALGLLQKLDLSNNLIKSLPEAMKDMSLVELKLAGNQITEIPNDLCYGTLAQSLKSLDLSRNRLTYLPVSFPDLKSLVNLKLDCNELQLLPRGFGKLKQLKFLSASSNKFAVLPHSFSRLTLESLDLFGNPLSASGLLKKCSNLGLPRLQELAGRVIRKHRIPYEPSTVPVMLCRYLDSAKQCLCGAACFEAFLHYIATMDLHKVSTTVIAVDKTGNTRTPVELFLCSARCLKLWRN